MLLSWRHLRALRLAHKFIGCRGGGSRSVNHGYGSRSAVCDASSLLLGQEEQKIMDPSVWVTNREIFELEERMSFGVVLCIAFLCRYWALADCDLLLVTIRQVKQEANSSQNSEMLVLKNQGTDTTVRRQCKWVNIRLNLCSLARPLKGSWLFTDTVTKRECFREELGKMGVWYFRIAVSVN